MLRDQSEERIKGLLREFATRPQTVAESKLVGTLYASLIDEPAIRKTGLKTIRADLRRIAAVKDIGSVADLMGALAVKGVGMPIATWVSPDERDPGVYSVHWAQGGLGLPDRDYYLKATKDAAAHRTAYRDYLAALGKLAGIADARAKADAALAFETELARIAWPNEDRRNPQKTYNPTKQADLAAAYGPFPWARFTRALHIPDGQDLIVAEKSYFEALGKLAAKTPLSTWRAYLAMRTLDDAAIYLDDRFFNLNHAFKGARLEGLKQAPPRWKNAVETMNWVVGEAIGRQYVARYFPGAAKAQAQVLVDNLLVAYREKITTLAWMTPTTRQAAMTKLDKLTVKIGYPDKWRGFEGLVLDRSDAIGNLAKVSEFRFRRDMADAGKKVDRSRWMMPPQIVNAYYDPSLNEICFPAAILQAPFFDPKADAAYNYGGIGAVIGHEISHGFDDQGRQYDADGKLRDWWTPADAAAFDERAKRLTEQYSSYQPIPGEHVNGKLTLGENIADLTGLTVSLRAYELSLGGKPAPTIGDYSGNQRFFLGYAQIWRGKDRPEWLRTRLLIDPHSPEEYRTNGVVTNMEAFYSAFGLKPEDKLFKAPADRVVVW